MVMSFSYLSHDRLVHIKNTHDERKALHLVPGNSTCLALSAKEKGSDSPVLSLSSSFLYCLTELLNNKQNSHLEISETKLLQPTRAPKPTHDW